MNNTKNPARVGKVSFIADSTSEVGAEVVSLTLASCD